MAEIRVKSEIAGSVWKILKQPGEAVAAEEDLLSRAEDIPPR